MQIDSLIRRRIPSEGIEEALEMTRDDTTEQNKTKASQNTVKVIVANAASARLTRLQSNSVRTSKLTFHWIRRCFLHFKAVQHRGLSAWRFGVQEMKNVMLKLDPFDP